MNLSLTDLSRPKHIPACRFAGLFLDGGAGLDRRGLHPSPYCAALVLCYSEVVDGILHDIPMLNISQ